MRFQLFQFAKKSHFGRLPLVLCLALLVCLGGCSGKKGPKTKVSGTVTAGGKEVLGEIVFVGEDGKEYTSPVAKGAYGVSGLPPGKYKVGVRQLGIAALPPPQKTGAKPVNSADMPPIEGPGVAPPAKFAKAASSGLEYEVTEGDQTKDFELK